MERLHTLLRDESMMGLQYAFSSVAPFMTLILGIITVILVTLLYVRYITQRKKEICLLKVNGLSVGIPSDRS